MLPYCSSLVYKIDDTVSILRFRINSASQKKHATVVEEELRQKKEKLAIARETAELEHRRYQDLFDLAPDAYLVTDVDGIIKEANMEYQL